MYRQGFDAVKLARSFQSQPFILDQIVEIKNCVFLVETILTV